MQNGFIYDEGELRRIENLLAAEGAAMEELLADAVEVRRRAVGDGIFLRGLIEYSNVCRKNCLYCGIRRGMEGCGRYTLSREQVLEAAGFAMKEEWGSIVLQGGESTSPEHITEIEWLLREITLRSEGRLGITISFGEQSAETYARWREAGAHRYLLRVESSDPAMYARLHPADGAHDYADRVRALEDLRRTGYQVGTGVMIGVPGQTLRQLAADLLFMKGLDIDMCGMGPYVESSGTPLAAIGWPEPPASGDEAVDRVAAGLRDPARRLEMTLRMIAVLRTLMPDINIAAATALEAIDESGREMALDAGANVVMINITPQEQRANYSLYDNKPFNAAALPFASRIRFGVKGDPLHFDNRRPEGGQ